LSAVLDTHVLVWSVVEPSRLSRSALMTIRKARAQAILAIADITLWELATLFARGRIRTQGSIEDAVRAVVRTAGVIIKPVTPEIAALATQFPDDFPHDPGDRLIAATARAEGSVLVTRDEAIRRSPLLRTIW